MNEIVSILQAVKLIWICFDHLIQKIWNCGSFCFSISFLFTLLHLFQVETYTNLSMFSLQNNTKEKEFDSIFWLIFWMIFTDTSWIWQLLIFYLLLHQERVPFYSLLWGSHSSYFCFVFLLVQPLRSRATDFKHKNDC